MKYSNNIDGLSDDKQIQEIYLYIKNNFLSKGEIVELGTFLGKVTKTILDAVPKKFDGRIYTYDNFVWNFNHNRKFPHLGLTKNQNFLDYVKKKIDSKKIIFKKQLIEDLKWEEKKIELLILDSPKNFDEINDVFFKLSPFFLENITKIIFLDFSISIKYDTQIFLNKIADYFSTKFSTNGIAYCEYKKKINFNKFDKFEITKKMKTEEIILFWNNFFKKIDYNQQKRLSLLPALHLYENKNYIKSYRHILFKNVYVQKKYILSKYMIKRYPLLIPLLIFQFFRGKFFI